MNWADLISSKRYGKSNDEYAATERRTEFQRDFDRLIFSAAFRRMQNKTQVFPLPGSVFVHNRLTHSLEVSSVGRSLGNDVAGELMQRHDTDTCEALQSMGAIVSAACLAHDMGNPPFGHSGESAIRTFFSENQGESLRHFFTEQGWQDVVKFDGNANTFRLLTHQFVGRRKGGFVMTYSTLASIVKYPFSSTLAPKSKFGFFAEDQAGYVEIARSLGIPLLENDGKGGVKYARHPLVYLVEAADDICYEIMDIEDAHKLRILSFDETEDLLLSFFEDKEREQIRTTYTETVDANDRVAFYRACVINTLERACVKLFVDNEETLLSGEFEGSLIDNIPEPLRSNYKRCAQLARKRIYQCKEVTDIDLAGYHIIYTLLKLMVEAVLHPDHAYSKLLLNQASSQYPLTGGTEAQRIMAVLDYLTGMTDVFALDLYRKINGHSLPVI
ncbi:MAG: dNTP triphosphohydrolase [Bacteroidaceae bacterium]|nr:dNTP triphosphohydrolase [Bacteroidaceae bacterium]